MKKGGYYSREDTTQGNTVILNFFMGKFDVPNLMQPKNTRFCKNDCGQLCPLMDPYEFCMSHKQNRYYSFQDDF